MVTIRMTKGFRRDLKTVIRRGCPKEKLNEAIAMLQNEEALPKPMRPHQLRGKWSGYEECHIEPDWLLIYKYEHIGSSLW